jgi:hypothetical protein
MTSGRYLPTLQLHVPSINYSEATDAEAAPDIYSRWAVPGFTLIPGIEAARNWAMTICLVTFCPDLMRNMCHHAVAETRFVVIFQVTTSTLPS